MADNSKIGWTDATWNAVTGCTKVSAGCDRCYAETFAERWRGIPGHHFENGFDVTLRPERLDQPLRWTRPRRIFVNSMSDLFHDAVPDEFIARVFATMARAPQHIFQVLTKRHGRMRSLLGGADGSGHRLLEATTDEETARALYDGPWPLPNVHLGVSVEDQRWADIRIPALLATPAAVRWISAEPLIGPFSLAPDDHSQHESDFMGTHYECVTCSTDERQVEWRTQELPPIDWVVIGGESGRGARAMDVNWARSLVAECARAKIPVFMKQLGSVAARAASVAGKGEALEDLPADLRVREYPQAVFHA